jgi:hypothetical protein
LEFSNICRLSSKDMAGKQVSKLNQTDFPR